MTNLGELMMFKHKGLKYVIISVLVFLLITIGGVFAWVNNTYKPSEELLTLVSQDDYQKIGDFYVFNAKVESNGTGIVLYPGALVEPLSYAYYANELSKQGYLVAIAEVTFNLSIMDNEKASEFISEHEEIESWYVAGHSMGGVSATMYANNHKDIVDGVILLASYPSSSTDLSETDLSVLSIYAQNDGLSTVDKIQDKSNNLPSETTYVEIIGGNHAQFGMYGNQSGDGEATVSVIDQQNQMVSKTLYFLK